MAKRKRLTMLVTVSVPDDLTAAEARREVRTLINHQSGWLSRLEEGDVKAISVKPVKTEHVTFHPVTISTRNYQL